MCLSEAYKKSLSRHPKRASTEALHFWLKIDLYPDILGFRGIDGKTYGTPSQRRLQGRKTAIFNPYHDIFSALSARLDL
jgi:hypothetical protein